MEIVQYSGQETSVGMLGPKLQTPCRVLCSGISGCGKTQFVFSLLQKKKSLFSTDFKKILYFYSEYQETFSKMKNKITNIHFIKGLPDKPPINDTKKENGHILIVFDDLMNESSHNTVLLDLFTRGSHHNFISCILMSQNLFFQGKHFRTISLNAEYIIAWKNPRDMSQIHNLSRQIFPDNSTGIRDVYTQVTENNPHSYIFIDLKQNTPDNLRVWSDILSEKPIVFQKKEKREK